MDAPMDVPRDVFVTWQQYVHLEEHTPEAPGNEKTPR